MRSRQVKVLGLLDESGACLHGLLTRLTLREDVAGDIMQELFIRLSGSSGFDKARDPAAYAWRAAMNLAFEWRRKSRLKFQRLDELALPASNECGPLASMVRAEELGEVLDAVERLRGLAREVIVMRYIEQESYEKIAGRLGKKPQHVRSVSSKALGRLRELLAVKKDDSGGKG